MVKIMIKLKKLKNNFLAVGQMCELLAKKANVKFLAICTDCLHLLGYSHNETKIQVKIYCFIFIIQRTDDDLIANYLVSRTVWSKSQDHKSAVLTFCLRAAFLRQQHFKPNKILRLGCLRHFS